MSVSSRKSSSLASVATTNVMDYSIGILPFDQTQQPLRLHSNNIFDEIKNVKANSKIRRVDFVAEMEISPEEYEESLGIVENIANDISDFNISEIISIEKPIHLMKQIMENYFILMGEPVFNWATTRERLNLHEVKYKMLNLDYKKILKRNVNYVMNKISTNTQYTEHNLESDDMQSFTLFYRFTLNVIKVFIYASQKTKKHTRTRNIVKKTATVTPSEMVLSNSLRLPIVEEKVKKSEIIQNTYLTGVRQESKVSKAVSASKPKKLAKVEMNLPQSHDFNFNRSLKNYLSLTDIPYMKNKNFLQLRRIFGLGKNFEEKFNYRHYEEISKVSLQNPKNVDKIIDKMSRGKFKHLPTGVFQSFGDNLDYADYFKDNKA